MSIFLGLEERLVKKYSGREVAWWAYHTLQTAKFPCDFFPPVCNDNRLLSPLAMHTSSVQEGFLHYSSCVMLFLK